MFAASVNSFHQLAYDAGSDFTVGTDAQGIDVIRPLNDDTTGAFLNLQHAINRVGQTLGLPLLAENGVLDGRTFLAVFQIANSDRVVTQAASFIGGLPAGGAYNQISHLGTFRSKFPPGPELTNFMNVSLLDLARRARLWGSLFNALADTIWWSSLSNATAPVIPQTSKLMLAITATLGAAVGVGAMVLVLAVRRRRR